MSARPIILTTMSNVKHDGLAGITGDTDIAYTDRATSLAVFLAGGLPLYLPSLKEITRQDLRQYVELADGVLLTGADTNTDSALYGEQDLGFGGRIDSERDETDVQLVNLALEARLPLMGICKGMQVINAALGGKLYQDVAAQHPSDVSHNSRGRRFEVTHSANLVAGSLLSDLAGTDRIELKGGHQQAVKELAPRLFATAIAEDGVVEAYETTAYPFLLGTQFHPELRLSESFCRGIFEAFVAAAATRHEERHHE